MFLSMEGTDIIVMKSETTVLQNYYESEATKERQTIELYSLPN